MVECAPAQIDQVLLNLIVNAAQAMPEGQRGMIDIATGVQGGAVWIEVKDNGPGIPEAILNKIFDPFFTTKDPGMGTGLGLSVSQNIIQQHGGTLAVQSTVGVGTTFTITLPIRLPAQVGSVSESETSIQTPLSNPAYFTRSRAALPACREIVPPSRQTEARAQRTLYLPQFKNTLRPGFMGRFTPCTPGTCRTPPEGMLTYLNLANRVVPLAHIWN